MGFTDNPIINSPFEAPAYCYELDSEGQPTGVKLSGRRESIQVVPVPAARRRGPKQAELDLFDEAQTKITSNALINEIRKHVDQWRALPSSQWGVTPETQRLLLHWREPSRARRLYALWNTPSARVHSSLRFWLSSLRACSARSNSRSTRMASSR